MSFDRSPCPVPNPLALANAYLTLTLVTGDGFNQCHVPATSTRLKSSPWPSCPQPRPLIVPHFEWRDG